ncbi:MAG: hypothetical protein GYB66_08015, partial [Chloroflexi bacterium]|nr:hypothetical protein [Chloroflexota bacterium]
MRLRLLIIPCIIMVASMTVIRIALAAQPDSPDVPRYQDGGVLTLGQTVNGTLSPSVPENQWSLVAPQESRANLTLTRMAGSAPLTVMIYNPAGTIIVSLNTDTQGLASLPQLYLEGGTYSVKVRADFTTTAQETSFTLSIQSNTVTAVTPVPTMTRTLPPTVPPDQLAPTITPLPSLDTPTPTIVPSPVGPPPVRLEIGEVYEGELTTPGDTHRFSFVGYAESF